MRVAVILTNAFNFKEDKCWWAIKKLAKVVKASEKQVSSAIKVFKEHHIFKIASGRTGKANEYKPNFDIILQYPTLAIKKTPKGMQAKPDHKITEVFNQQIFIC